ncbi:MAG: hypothetical protein FWE91_08490 [Defluviitaleaceae bacterium]|nr:hypothetical protein [Defluviitaleaceae bacterium]MCL2835274.1 hypothetical protein [Defluviitaleaceae bacterium]
MKLVICEKPSQAGAYARQTHEPTSQAKKLSQLFFSGIREGHEKETILN